MSGPGHPSIILGTPIKHSFHTFPLHLRELDTTMNERYVHSLVVCNMILVELYYLLGGDTYELNSTRIMLGKWSA